MAEDLENPFKEGYLWIPHQGSKNHQKKPWRKLFCQLFSASQQGIERLEVYESEENVSSSLPERIITLENCIKITKDPQRNQLYHSFTVISKTATYFFGAESQAQMVEWMNALQSVAFGEIVQRRGIEEENELYCHSIEAGVFQVRLVNSKASLRCGLTSGDNYTLIAASTELRLKYQNDSNEDTFLYNWPYRYIRKYGYKSGQFCFEAGRKCGSGEGVFIFEHSNHQEIFKCISQKMKKMKEMLNDDTIFGGDNQFIHALSMNPGSRSPLPPSTSEMSFLNLDAVKKPLPPPKPPRKNPPRKSDIHYDEVEVRYNAWKTLGGDLSVERFESPNVFTKREAPDNYDILDHFGSTPKLEPESVYEQVQKLSGSAPDITIESDAHLGYGVIRKTSGPPHTLYNDSEYAMVLKTHRV